MDKETLSNYGWIVICVLVLAVMIALATPFGSFVSEAVQSTTKGLFDVNKSALDSTGLINIDNQEFDVPDMNHGAETPVPVVPGATFSDGVTLTWEEMKLEENGTKYGYKANLITETNISLNAFGGCTSLTSIVLPDSIKSITKYAFLLCTSLKSIDLSGCTNLTSIGEGAFMDCSSLTSVELPEGLTSISSGFVFENCTSLTSIAIPASLTTLGYDTFENCTSLTSINFAGSMEDWGNITLGSNWNANVPATYVQCSDGQVPLS